MRAFFSNFMRGESAGKNPKRQIPKSSLVSRVAGEDFGIWRLGFFPADSPRMKLEKNARIYVAGHRGLVGSAIWRELERQGFSNLIGRTRAELDLLNAAAVREFYAKEKPDFVFVAAAKVGGILANSNLPAQFLYENLQIQNHLIHGAHEA